VFFSKPSNKSGDIDLNNGNTCNSSAKCKPSTSYKYPAKNIKKATKHARLPSVP